MLLKDVLYQRLTEEKYYSLKTNDGKLLMFGQPKDLFLVGSYELLTCEVIAVDEIFKVITINTRLV